MFRRKFDGSYFKRYVHRLVAQYFIPNPEGKPVVNHIDGDKYNNHVSNLEWVTYSENNAHAYKTGLKQPSGLRPVFQFSKEGMLLQRFKSTIQAEEVTGIHKKKINNAISYRYATGGFLWFDKSKLPKDFKKGKKARAPRKKKSPTNFE